MSRSLNKATLIGVLGRDPEMRYMPNGNAVCNFSIATDESYTDKNSNQKVEKTEWHKINAFGKLAEIMGQYLKKGSKVYIEGKLQTREWEKDGIKRYSTEIVASQMLMLDSKQGQQTQQAPQQQPAVGYQQPPANQLNQGFQNPNGTQGSVAPARGYQAPDPQSKQNLIESGNFDDDIPF